LKTFDLNAFLPYQLAVLSARVSRGFAAHYRARFGISTAEWRIVAHLSQAGEVSVGEMTRRVELEKSKVSRAATRLKAMGYITKHASATDKRLVSLALTDKGRAMIADLTPVALAYEAEVLQALQGDAPAYRRMLNDLLRATADN